MSKIEQAVKNLAEALGYELLVQGRTHESQVEESGELYCLVPASLMDGLLPEEEHYDELHVIINFLVERVQELLHVDFDHDHFRGF
ncbi:MAG: hypothetical protein ACO1N6_06660 [Microcella sp.]